MTLSHDVAGNGPALVLLHSGVCDRRMWDAQWPALIDAGYQVVRCDFRGFGSTPAADRPYSDAEDVRELLDTLGIARAALVGASYGGQVALEIAARRAERVSAVALLCSARPGHEPSGELRALGEREEALIEAGDLTGAVELMVDTWLGPDAAETAREAVRRMQRRAYEVQLAAAGEFEPIEAEPDLGAVRAPCLVVSGGHDLADFREIAAQLPALLTTTTAHHVDLPWAGHLPNLERPSAVTGLLVGFLREKVLAQSPGERR
ncbi:alpha/beta fold hydrolase [Streptomyces sp. NPDC051567]|uniref:alpha/beta fold hydrolase n=1 Tax=Streptomyces sp. NPDC051567 TaxID=3365660 RepID=UPI00379AC30D